MGDYLVSNWVPIICGGTILVSGSLLAIFGWKYYKEKPKTEDSYQKLNFTIENLKNSQNSYQRLKNIISEIKDDKKINKDYLKQFEKAMNDDLDTSNALKVLWKLARDENAIGKIQTIKKMDEVFGLDLLKKEKIIIPNNIQKLVNERESARKKKDFKKADELRNKIKSLGYKVDDIGDGPKLSKINNK